MGMSPQNRPLTYSYSASAGTVSGSGTTAVFSSTGAPTGAVGITCNVSDDKGQTATASTGVTITAPYVAPVPHTAGPLLDHLRQGRQASRPAWTTKPRPAWTKWPWTCRSSRMPRLWS